MMAVFVASLWRTLLTVLVISVVAILAARWSFGLSFVSATAIYFVVWWISMFVALPLRIRSQVEAGDVAAGTEPGAPADPALREKAIITTFIAAILLIALAAVSRYAM